MRWFDYTTDAGEVFAIFCDEGNFEAINTAQISLTALTGLPREFKPRHCYFRSVGEPNRVLRVPVGTPADYVDLQTASPSTNYTFPQYTGNFQLIRFVPERIKRRPTAIDTGITDGDNP
jgi:hypothetical protein